MPANRRSIGLWQMTLYGAGSMLGADIYGLVGQVAAEMGSAIWLAFLLSLVAAGLTGLSYAPLRLDSPGGIPAGSFNSSGGPRPRRPPRPSSA